MLSMGFLNTGTAAEYTVLAARFKTEHVENLSEMESLFLAG